MESKRDTTENRFEKLMKDDFLTSKEYFDETQQGPFGFYNGTVDFAEDFTTYASSPYKVPGFAARVANQLFSAREMQLAKGALGENDDFNVMECGGGNGNLCLHVLDYIEKMAKINSKWKSLSEKIHYNLVECSPALVKAQAERNAKHVKSGKVTVTEGNALDLNNVLQDKNKKIAVALSNELVDMLQPHMVTLGEDNTLKVKQTLPTISKASLRKVIATLPTTDEDKAAVLKQFEEKSSAYKEELRRNGETACKTLLGDSILLSRNSYLILNRWCLKNKIESPFKIQEAAITPADSIPELKTFIERHPQFVAQIKAENKPGETYLANTNYSLYLQGVKNKLLPNGGQILTIDYGKNKLMKENNSTRTYSNSELGRDVYANGKDVTSDVDWTEFVKDGESLGLQKTYYNKQGAMRVDMIPDSVLSAKDKRVFEEKDRFGTFQILVQTNEEKPDLNEVAKRFSKPSQPVSYEELDAIPPLYTIESGKIKVNLSQMDIDFIDSQIAAYDEQIKMARAKQKGEVVVINIPIMEGNPATVIQCCTMVVALWNKVKTGALISEVEKNALMNLGPTPDRIKQYPTVEQEADLRPKRYTSKPATATPVSSTNLFTKRVTLEYKDGASNYLQGLSRVVEKAFGEDIVKIDQNKHHVSFMVGWLKQLGDKFLTELSTELDVEKSCLRR